MCYVILMVDIHRSARKHGCSDEDIRHAYDNALVVVDLDDERQLVIGPRRSGDLLELVALLLDAGGVLIIHAMPLRAKYRHLLR